MEGCPESMGEMLVPQGLNSSLIKGDGMLRELARQKWGSLSGKPGSSPVRMADAIDTLARTKDADEASEHYWLVDGCAFDEDRVYPIAVPTIPVLLEALQISSGVGRPHVLELLAQIAARSGVDDLGVRCRTELSRGLSLFIHWLEVGSIEEKTFCVDVLVPLAIADNSLRERIIWLMERARSDEGNTGLDRLIKNCIDELGR